MIPKNTLSKFVEEYSIEVIEGHLIHLYLTQKKLDYSVNPMLQNYFNNLENALSKDSILNFNIELHSVKDLENCLELIIPQEDRKLNGAFFTPTYIVDFIIEELQPNEKDECIDLSCGTGAFLIGLVDYFKNKYNNSIKTIIQQNIFGSDILEYNIKRAKVLLSILALEYGENLEESDFNLYHQDSLRTDWQERQFDVVVGNPPYVKFQDLSEDNRMFLLKEWKSINSGTFNLYFAFFELGYQLLKENGRLGYITPNNYFTSLAAKTLRGFFTENKCVYRIIDFSHKKVFDAQTYTALTFLNKQKNEAITYDRIKNEQIPSNFLLNVNGSPNYLKNLKVKKWRLLKTKEQNNIRLIETVGTPIKQLFDICVGIATLKDTVFFVDMTETEDNYLIKTTEKGTFKIEVAATKPVYKISDFKKQADIACNARRIIFPYNIVNDSAKPIEEEEFKNRFPKCYEYLLSEKEVLEKRDKGKVKFSPFYVWGRTQGLTKMGKKMLNPTFSQYPRFLLIEEVDAFFTNGYGIFFRKATAGDLFATSIHPLMDVKNRDVSQKILNSVVMHYYVSQTSVSIAGGYPCYQKNFIEKFTVPNFTLEEVERLRNMNDWKEIDDFLINKYGLTIEFDKGYVSHKEKIKKTISSKTVLVNPQ
ncbi:MAG: N-6 DNA methylase [Chitinophagales bacterium]